MDVPVSHPVRRIVGYELHAEVARGGMASVHLGRLGPVGFARTVAIKTLHPDDASDPAVVRMFIDEARVASRAHGHRRVFGSLGGTAQASLTGPGEIRVLLHLPR